MKTVVNQIIKGSNQRAILVDSFIPQATKPLPVVVFCHGYKGFKDWGAWNLMAAELCAAGFAVITFNFSHNGGTVSQPIDFPDLEAFAENNYSKELYDLQKVIGHLEGLNGASELLDLENIYLLGHSRGGGIVTLTAAQDNRVAKVVSLAGVSDYGARFLEGTPHFKQWQQEGTTYVENTRTGQMLPHNFQFYTDFIANEDSLTIKTAAQNINIPHLIVHGTADPTVGLQEAQNLHAWSTNSELFLIPEADHVFGMKHPWTKTALPVHMQQAVGKIISFLK